MQNKILIDYDTSVKDISYMLERKYGEFSKLGIKKHLMRKFEETINSYKYYFPNIEFQWISNYINLYKKIEGLKWDRLIKSYEIENSYFNTANILKNVILINIK